MAKASTAPTFYGEMTKAAITAATMALSAPGWLDDPYFRTEAHRRAVAESGRLMDEAARREAERMLAERRAEKEAGDER